MSTSLKGLARAVGTQPTDPTQFRNVNLNAAFAPPQGWPTNTPEQQGLINATPQGNTEFDPFLGTGWDQWLDRAGAKQPGGINIGTPRRTK